MPHIITIEDGKRVVTEYSSVLRVIPSADIDEVLLEQLEYLIEHTRGGLCGCSECGRYQRVRAALMEVFG